MKRTYIKPTTQIICVNNEKMMASSDRIPLDPTPSIPAARKDEWVKWENNIW